MLSAATEIPVGLRGRAQKGSPGLGGWETPLTSGFAAGGSGLMNMHVLELIPEPN